MNKTIVTADTVRRVLKDHFGIALSRFDVIHHIDHNPRNNDIRNLIRLTHVEHSLAHRAKPPAPKTPRQFRQWLRVARITPWKVRQWSVTEIKTINSYAGTPCTECGRPFQIGDFYTSRNGHQFHAKCF